LLRHVKSFMEDFMFAGRDKHNEKLIFMFGVVFWSLWLNRNDLVFNNKIIASPKALIFKFVFFLQYWMIAWTGPDKEGLELFIESLMVKVVDD
jgi:hypothetical protein